MLPVLKELLIYLEDNINEQRILNAEKLHCDTLTYKTVESLPIITAYPYPKEAEFQPFPHREIFDNPEKMLFNQFVSSFGSIYLSQKIGDDLPITIRPDFGCVLVASIFGAKVEQVEDNPPWIRHSGEKISYEQIIQTPAGDFNSGLIAKVTDRYKFYNDVLIEYPKLLKLTNIVLPDLQGPFDNLELICGSSIFLDMYSHRELFLKAMEKITSTQIELAKYFRRYVNNRIEGFSFQHGFALKGGILIRNDTSIMVSPQMYDELIAPFDEKILQIFGGGIHSCGNVNNAVKHMFLKSAQCFDFGQSELNNIENIYKFASEKKIGLTRIACSEQELLNGGIQKKYPSGISLIFRAESFEHAEKIIIEYKQSHINVIKQKK
ncbi:MAG: hypothetical protein A2Y10_19830 [Planctomycetes bacterium GWF2_41_51]|nr:MAG: hypothetical protein A2Y10_19830 [Planctomycetes bacterium GWF2_41_51]HBG28535.1 hypothetical protein [Phycisphaerales bacterium]